MPGTPINVNGLVTVKVDGIVVLTVNEGSSCTVPYGSPRSETPEPHYTVSAGGDIVHSGGTYIVPSGKEGIVAGPGIGIP